MPKTELALYGVVSTGSKSTGDPDFIKIKSVSPFPEFDQLIVNEVSPIEVKLKPLAAVVGSLA